MTMEHLERSFLVTLHIQHPVLDVDEITRALQLTPWRQTAAGPPRRAPFDQAWWAHRFDGDSVRELVPFLEQILPSLERHREYLHSVVDTGGSIELFCGVHVDFNWDEAFPFHLLAAFGNLKIDLRLNVYPQGSEQRT